ncbi:protein translocase subunit SecD [uncultured Jatrophihabitans sp.]|uniref:protein translocase subunit SecD n=1 Tax=uncultured Jatrophihabitans sp. TaxID=1610747 RepID=UPI0035CB15C5
MRVQISVIENAEENFPVAPPPGTLRVGRYFAALIVLLGLLYLAVGFPGARHTPKLGIDLVGGKRVIFTARTGNGTTPTSSSMSQARQIIEDRINGTGVTGATVQVQGDNQLVVLIPGGTDTDVAALGQPAVLNFRGVVAPAQVVTCTPRSTSASGASSAPSTGASGALSTAPKATASASAGTSPSATSNGFRERPLAAAPTPSTTPSTPAATTAKASPTTGASSGAASTAATSKPAASSSAAATTAAPVACLSDPIAALVKTDPGLKNLIPNAEKCPSPSQTGTCRAFSTLSAARQTAIASALRTFDCESAVNEPDEPNRYYIACGSTPYGTAAYLLGHVIVKGSQVDSASAQAPSTGSGGSNAEWTVALTLKSSGGDRWSKWTSAYHTTSSGSAVQTSDTAPCGVSAAIPCSMFVAFTLNGQVVSAPITQATLDLQTQISGSFKQKSADELATQLNYGSLPLSFRTDANDDVSATLGTQQLHAALLAGGIGLALVVLYSLLYYRGLGIVTIASLLVSAVLTYAMLVILGTQIGFTLDLAGVAGFIVALGITADSFVVFFERIKDEVHEGRSIRVAVPRAWVRARRTILSADTVSFLAAAILYYFASADVKGFAFTLGMSTILDLVVVFLFTHPIVSLLSRSRTFGSPRFTGLNSVRTGSVVDDELPARRSRKPARAASSASAGPPKQGETATQRAQLRRGVAVLDEPEADDPDDTDDVDSTDDVLHDTAGDVRDETADVEVVDDTSDDEPDVEAAPTDDDDQRSTRRRTTPQSGSAAERAAARRARLREQREKGDS